MKASCFTLSLLLVPLWLACQPNVVDAVLEPPELPDPGMPDPGMPSAGMPDPGMEPDPEPVDPLQTSLIHRYSFSGTGTTVWDSKYAAHGEVIDAELDGDGTLTLVGEHSGQYVNLPNRLISPLSSATFETWLTWQGGAAWQRIFDFGNSTSGEDLQGARGTSYLFLTTASIMPPTLRAAFSTNGVGDEETCNGPAAFPSMALTHVALVVDPELQTMALYQDGTHLVTCPLSRPLSLIDDVNNWLGHSNFEIDADLRGSYDEFRIYDAALTAEQLAQSYAAGPDAEL